MSFYLSWRIWKTMKNTYDDDDLNAWMRVCDKMTDNNRKTILISILLALVVFTAIFAWFKAIQSSSTSTSVAAAQEESMFEVVEWRGTIPRMVVVYHKKTKVMYMMPESSSVATVMVDADGKPLLYEP